ncbi:MAG: FAD-binding protein [Spirochaetales bacterium]|jgi:predicted oxidoreductase|nr:FAD-binding protein [Spirochaetales bacterium]
MKKISRREFLKNTGVAAGAAVGGGLLLSGCTSLGKGQTSPFGAKPDPTKLPEKWDLEADVVVIGSGAVGLPAAIRARDAGASVLVVECNYDIGGHAITSGGNVPLGGGTSWQIRDGIQDDPDTLFRDLVDFSVVNPQGAAIYRYNDREIHRVMADNMAPAFEFLLENKVRFVEQPVDNRGANGTGLSAPREVHTIWLDGCSAEAPAGAGGTMLCRDLEVSAREKGVQFLLNYHMDIIFRESLTAGRVVGIQASYTPTILPGTTEPLASFHSNGNITLNAPTVTVKANKAIIVGTGGSSGNVALRRVADPRLTEEIPNSLEEYSPQDGSGELAIIAIGGTLWGTANQTLERWGNLTLSPIVGSRNNYPNVRWDPNTPLLPKIKYIGVTVRSWQNAIMVNQVGKRFYNEMSAVSYPAGTANGLLDNYGGYTQGDWRNGIKLPHAPNNYLDAALALNEGSGPPDYAAGPQWAILDADGVARMRWDLEPSYAVDPNLFFKADTLEELADKISTCTYQHHQMSGAVLRATVERYNSFVGGTDADFAKPTPQYRIEKPPFYAAWNTVQLHDTYMGARINGHCQVLTLEGEVIPGLYCGGESSGGASAHGLARCIAQGYIAGYEAAVTG